MRRLLLQHRGFAGLSIVTLTLAVGANVAVFTIVNALWLRPLPFPDADRLVVLMRDRTAPGSEESASGIGLESSEHWLAFAGVAGQVVTTGDFASLTPHLVLEGIGAPVETLGVSPQYFRLFGLTIRGRDFTREDDRYAAEPVAIISDRLWRRVFGGNAGVIGAVAEARPFPVRIVGVAPPGFAGARRGERADVWIPRNLVPRLASGGQTPPIDEDSVPTLVFARLHPGQTAGQAIERLHAGADDRRRRALAGVAAIPLGNVFGTPDSPTVIVREEGAARVVASLAGLVLLAGCMTLMTLALVHYDRRRRELAVRLSLGASPRQVVALLSRELGWIAALAAVAALLVSAGSLRVLPALRLPGGVDISRLDLSLDWRVAAAALALAVGTLAAAALLPLRRCARADLVRDLVGGSGIASASRSAQRLKQVLLGIHVTAAAVVLVCAGLFVRTVFFGFQSGAGFDADRVLFVEAQLVPLTTYSPETRAARAALIGERTAGLREDLPGIPGIEAVAFGESPIGPAQARRALAVRKVDTGGEARQLSFGAVAASPEWLPTLGVPLLAGRALSAADRNVQPRPAVVTASLARTLWQGRDPLGRTLTVNGFAYAVVGVVRDFAFGQLGQPHAGVLVSVQAAPPGGLAQFVVRAEQPHQLVDRIREIVSRRVPDAPRLVVSTGREMVAQDLGQARLGAWFFSGFGIVALALGAGGVFGLVAYLFESRRREFGVRLALGATRRGLVCHGLVTALTPVAIGVVSGLLAAVLIARSFTSVLIGVTPADPATYAGVALAILAAAAAAALLAAGRLGRVTPGDALRAERNWL